MNHHVGIPTASGFDNLLTPKFELRKGEMPKSYLYRKVAEKWRGQPLVGFTGVFDVEQGSILEEEALPFFELETGKKVTRVGFITTDDGRAGCSPDGLLEVGGLEAKCPAAHTHVKYLLSGALPDEYAAQVFGSMYVTGAPEWTFLSYRRKFPSLILTILRDEQIMERIAQALELFQQAFDNAMERVKAANEYSPFR
jgi:hypothetical protein